MSIRVTIVSHAYVYEPYRKKIEELAKFEDLEVSLITPEHGVEGGNQQVIAEKHPGSDYDHRILPGVFTGRLNTFVFRDLKRTLRELNPDVILLEEEYWTNVSYQITRLVKTDFPKTKIALISQENINHIWEEEGSTWYQKLRFSVFHWMEQRILSRVDGLSFQFDSVWAEFQARIEQLGFRGLKWTVPQLGVDLETFKWYDADLLSELSSELEITPDTVVFGNIGRIIPEKGLEDALRAFAQVKNTHTKMLLVGNGSEEYVTTLQDLASSLGIQDRVIFRGAVPFDQIPTYFRVLDVFFLLSHTTPEWKEQFGRVLVETMAAKRALIGSDSGAIPGVIGEAGIIVPEKDVAAIANAMKKLADDPQLRQEYGEKGYQRAHNEFTYAAIASKTREFIQTLCT